MGDFSAMVKAEAKEAMQFAAEQALDLLMDEEELNTDKMR